MTRRYPLELYHEERSLEPYDEVYEEDTLPIFPGMSLRDFMEQTTAYEDQPVAFSPRLRQGTWMGMTLTLLNTITLFVLSSFGAENLSGPFFMLFGSQLHAYMSWMLQSHLIMYIDGVLFGSGVVLLLQTRNLQRGKPFQHKLAFVHALAGSANLLILVLPLAVILLNGALWLLIGLLIAVGVILLLGLFVALL